MRKRKRRTNTPPSMEERTDTDTRTGNPGVDDENWDGTKAGTAKISRNITARGLDEANAELVTEVRHARQDKKKKRSSVTDGRTKPKQQKICLEATNT